MLASLLALGALAFALDLYRKIGFVFLAEQLLAASLGFGLALVYLRYPARRGTPRLNLTVAVRSCQAPHGGGRLAARSDHRSRSPSCEK